MDSFEITRHAAVRLAQRAISVSDLELIANFGTEVSDGYLFLDKNCVALETQLKSILQRVQKLRGKRIVVDGGQLITAYTASKSKMRKLTKQN
jgi:hypothetical protein